jgi:hypothetical protein
VNGRRVLASLGVTGLSVAVTVATSQAVFELGLALCPTAVATGAAVALSYGAHAWVEGYRRRCRDRPDG